MVKKEVKTRLKKQRRPMLSLMNFRGNCVLPRKWRRIWMLGWSRPLMIPLASPGHLVKLPGPKE